MSAEGARSGVHADGNGETMVEIPATWVRSFYLRSSAFIYRPDMVFLWPNPKIGTGYWPQMNADERR
jgi:hypothetical protein